MRGLGLKHEGHSLHISKEYLPTGTQRCSINGGLVIVFMTVWKRKTRGNINGKCSTIHIAVATRAKTALFNNKTILD